MTHMTKKELEKALDLHMEDKAFGIFFIAAMLDIDPDQVHIDSLRNCMNAYAEAKWWEGYTTGLDEADQIEHLDSGKTMTKKELETALYKTMDDKAFGIFFIAAMLDIDPDQVHIDSLRECMDEYAKAKWWDGYTTGLAEREQIDNEPIE